MKIDPKAYKELWEILKFIPKKDYNKIPLEMLDIVEFNMDDRYEYKVEHIKDFENQVMMEETKNLLAMFFIEYWASKDEKNNFFEELSKEQEKITEEKIVEKYMIVQSDKRFAKIIKKIKSILKLKK